MERETTLIRDLEHKPAYRLVRLNETQGYQDWLDRHEVKVKAVYTWYVYDANVVTHCREITPSYELHPVYPDYEGLTHAQLPEEGIYDDINDWMEQELDAGGDSEIRYVHCRDIDALPSILLLDTATSQSDPGWEIEAKEDTWLDYKPGKLLDTILDELCELRAANGWDEPATGFKEALEAKQAEG